MTFRAFRGDPFQRGIIQKWVTYNLTIFKGEIFMTLNMSGMELRGCEMEKEQLAKELMIKWFLENGRTNVEEILQAINSGSYEKVETKKAN